MAVIDPDLRSRVYRWNGAGGRPEGSPPAVTSLPRASVARGLLLVGRVHRGARRRDKAGGVGTRGLVVRDGLRPRIPEGAPVLAELGRLRAREALVHGVRERLDERIGRRDGLVRGNVSGRVDHDLLRVSADEVLRDL